MSVTHFMALNESDKVLNGRIKTMKSGKVKHMVPKGSRKLNDT